MVKFFPHSLSGIDYTYIHTHTYTERHTGVWPGCGAAPGPLGITASSRSTSLHHHLRGDSDQTWLLQGEAIGQGVLRTYCIQSLNLWPLGLVLSLINREVLSSQRCKSELVGKSILGEQRHVLFV